MQGMGGDERGANRTCDHARIGQVVMRAKMGAQTTSNGMTSARCLLQWQPARSGTGRTSRSTVIHARRDTTSAAMDGPSG